MILKRKTAIYQLCSLIKDYRDGGPYPTTDGWNYSDLELSQHDASKLIDRVIKSSEKMEMDDVRIVCLINTKLSIIGR